MDATAERLGDTDGEGDADAEGDGDALGDGEADGVGVGTRVFVGVGVGFAALIVNVALAETWFGFAGAVARIVCGPAPRCPDEGCKPDRVARQFP